MKSKPIANKDDVVTVVENIAKDQQTEEALLLFATSTLNVLARPWHSRQHQEIMNHPTPQVPFNQCVKCGKTFGSNRALRTHMTKEHQKSSV